MKPIALFLSLCAILFIFQTCKETGNTVITPVVVTSPGSTTTIPAATTAAVFYVSATTGDDSRTTAQAGSAATPWKTIQKGVSSIPGGATLVISGGTYSEKVVVPTSANGTATVPTLIRNKAGELPILDGNNTGVPFQGIVNLKDNQFITLKGLKAQNGFWYGFNGEATKNITFDSCSTFNTRASGIYVKTSSFLTIIHNNIRRACQEPGRDANGNGTQECISVVATGNFTVNKNEIWDSTVPGAAGGEGIDAKSGCFDGEISGNYVHDILPLGIYVDAGSKENYNIRVHANRVINTAGMSVAGEIGGQTREIFIYNNLVVNSISSGVSFQSIGNGKFTNVYIVNNTFYNNAQSGFAGDIGSYSTNTANTNLVIRNNIFHNKIANSRFSIWHNVVAAHVISHNLYFDFKVSNNAANSFNAAKLTAADVLTDPQFTNVAGNDFTLKAISPAINKGIVITLPGSTVPLFTTDFTGKARGTSPDMGAFEF